MSKAETGHHILWLTGFPPENGEKVENLFTEKIAKSLQESEKNA